MSVVRKDFWQLVSRRRGGVRSPIKKGLNGTIPAEVNSSVGSPAGISDADGIGRCPRSSKKLRKELRMLSPSIGIVTPLRWGMEVGYGSGVCRL